MPIERLYENGFARHKFLPCIALLQQHTQILNLDVKLDHRLHLIIAECNTPDFRASSSNLGIKGGIDFYAIFTVLAHTVQTVKFSGLIRFSYIVLRLSLTVQLHGNCQSLCYSNAQWGAIS